MQTVFKLQITMKHILIVILFLANASAESSLIRKKLEENYKKWKKAVAQKDYRNWKKYTAKYRQRIVKNNILSQKLAYPESIFSAQYTSPRIQNLKFLKTTYYLDSGYSDENSDSISAFYFGKVNFEIPNKKPKQENVLVLNFINQENLWKFNQAKFIRLENAPKIRSKIRNNDFSDLNGKEFRISPDTHITKKEVAYPNLIGYFRLNTRNYRTKISINGIKQGIFENIKIKKLIIGGLKTNINKIKIESTKLNENEQKNNELKIEILASNSIRFKGLKVYEFKDDKKQDKIIQTLVFNTKSNK